MNDKRYYWLKLEENYFDIKIQKALRKLPSGAEMLICYLKMQLRYLNKGGLIEFNGVCSDIAEEVALDIDEDIGLVKITLAVLTKWNVIEQGKDSLFLMEMQGRIGSKSDSALRVAKHRKNIELLHCNKDVTKCNSIQEIEKELELDTELDSNNTNINNIYDFIENNFGRTLAPIEYEKIQKWLDDFTEDIIKYAVELCVMQKVNNFAYLDGILRNWHGKTLEEVKQANEKAKIEKKEPKEIFEYDWLNDSGN